MPTLSTTADIFNGGTATITKPGEVCYALSLGSSAGSGTVQMIGGSLSGEPANYNGAFENVGYSGAGVFAQSGGINNAWILYLGCNPGGIGTYNLGGDGQLSACGGIRGQRRH